MKIKIINVVPREKTGMMVDLQPDEIVAVDSSVAQKLIDSGDAEFVI
jgi:hypothetical protein